MMSHLHTGLHIITVTAAAETACGAERCGQHFWLIESALHITEKLKELKVDRITF